MRPTLLTSALSVTAALTLTLAGATPASALSTVCVVNGVSMSGSVINGTNGPDTVVCTGSGSAGPDTTVNLLGGNDTFTLTTDSLFAGYVVNGGDGNDRFNGADDDLTRNFGTINGGNGDDTVAILNAPDEEESVIDTGNGNDTIDPPAPPFPHLEGTAGIIRTGPGDDQVQLPVMHTGEMDTGDGSDTITVRGWPAANEASVDSGPGLLDTITLTAYSPNFLESDPAVGNLGFVNLNDFDEGYGGADRITIRGSTAFYASGADGGAANEGAVFGGPLVDTIRLIGGGGGVGGQGGAANAEGGEVYGGRLLDVITLTGGLGDFNNGPRAASNAPGATVGGGSPDPAEDGPGDGGLCTFNPANQGTVTNCVTVG
ncbi:hypothetical protein [Streptomyces jumonjinensis]|uniref:Calcium-binding protein n=1 Tax=Streptomyces jumonjinensis TaxID=1945 RepID=A0A646KFQ0_STRJU|nr:hypothetical protein [Streptomyces jumonjinensis]MQT01112.1 hypothetical protein [Streptomyces jumonjinensis]